MTIEKPLYFCSPKFVGQFERVVKMAVSGGAASASSWLFPAQHDGCAFHALHDT
jgi:hypothetical protein